MIGRLNHVAIVVPDLATAAAAYREILGAKVSATKDLHHAENRLQVTEGLLTAETARFCSIFRAAASAR